MLNASKCVAVVQEAAFMSPDMVRLQFTRGCRPEDENDLTDMANAVCACDSSSFRWWSRPADTNTHVSDRFTAAWRGVAATGVVVSDRSAQRSGASCLFVCTV